MRGNLLVVHCFTCSKDLHTMSRLARGLAGAGFAVLRFDFTGLGESGGDFSATTLSTSLGHRSPVDQPARLSPPDGDTISLCVRVAPLYTRPMSNLERSPTATVSADCRPVAEQPVHEVLTASAVDLGEGTPVRRLLPKRQRATIGAWCFVDHYGPQDIAGRAGMRVPPHPHIGLQTVTWLLEGEVLHRDSLGTDQLIRPGQLNLMTAGRGIAHSEESLGDHPPVLHGVQLWTGLPERSADVEPSFEHLPELPTAQTAGIRVTVLMGELLGARSPARAYSELVGADLAIGAATDEDLALRPDFEHGAVVVSGEAAVDGVMLGPGKLLYLGTGRDHMAVRTAGPARLLLLGGAPFGEPLILWWNFVARTNDEIAQARADWKAGDRFGVVHGFPGPPLKAPPLPPGRLRPR